MKGEDVRALQKLMNCLGFKIANTGSGSKGKETNVFLNQTYNSVKKFQEAYASDILTPFKLTKGTGIFSKLSQKKAESI